MDIATPTTEMTLVNKLMGDLHAPAAWLGRPEFRTSWTILHLVLGDEPLFHVPPYKPVHPVGFVFYGLLALIGGLVSVWFVR